MSATDLSAAPAGYSGITRFFARTAQSIDAGVLPSRRKDLRKCAALGRSTDGDIRIFDKPGCGGSFTAKVTAKDTDAGGAWRISADVRRQVVG